MANVSLQPAPDGPSTEELIGRVERGLYIVGDKSWSIDMQRFNFQFTGQRFYRIDDGELVGQVRDVAYQATTTDFWGSMEAVGGPDTWVLGGAFNCGKAQPGQVAASATAAPRPCSAASASSTPPTRQGMMTSQHTSTGPPSPSSSTPWRPPSPTTASSSSATPPAPTCAGPTTP